MGSFGPPESLSDEEQYDHETFDLWVPYIGYVPAERVVLGVFTAIAGAAAAALFFFFF
jgi:hypothetical protein